MDNLYTNSIVQGSERSETTVFNDGSAQWHVSFPDGEDDTRGVALSDSLSLKDFFKRPVYAANYSWDPTSVSAFFQSIDPWGIFFSNTRVVNRISNYNLMHCKLRVKITVSGNSFYYGRLLVHYNPLDAFDKLSAYSTGTNTSSCVQASQGLHAFIDPTESQGCEFSLPFIWPYDVLSVPDSDVTKLGKLYLRQLAPLKHANGSNDPISISVFIWCEDISLSVPTTANASNITAQGDEYDVTPIASMAGAVAARAGKFVKSPVIGKYARATEIASGAMADMARLFGFSRPVSLAETVNMKPNLIGQLAVTNVTDMSTKLTVDVKQELTIDSNVVGIKSDDELSLVVLASKQSYLTQFPWATSRLAGALLWEARVTPSVYDVATGTYPKWFLPACAFVANPFTYWRGTMRYRFQIVASAFHKGRLAITWDPYAMSGTIQPNVVHTRVIDLASERDVIVDIPWGSSRHYLNTLALTTALSFQTSGHFASNIISSNGAISVTVLNELTSPSVLVNNDISINVYVSMCEDAEFAVPRPDRIDNITFAPAAGIQTQGDEYDDSGNTPDPVAASEVLDTCLSQTDASNLVYFGEKIASFRQLLKRYYYLSPVYNINATVGDRTSFTVSDFPFYFGFYPTGAVLSGANRFNFTRTTMINYLTPAYIAARGGIRRKYSLVCSTAPTPSLMTVTRAVDNSNIVPSYVNLAEDFTSSLTFQSAHANASFSSGGAITSVVQQPTIEVELPYYKNVRFDMTRWPSGNSTVASQAALCHTLQYPNVSSKTYVETFISAAEDFTLLGFQGCPPFYIT